MGIHTSHGPLWCFTGIGFMSVDVSKSIAIFRYVMQNLKCLGGCLPIGTLVISDEIELECTQMAQKFIMF